MLQPNCFESTTYLKPPEPGLSMALSQSCLHSKKLYQPHGKFASSPLSHKSNQMPKQNLVLRHQFLPVEVQWLLWRNLRPSVISHPIVKPYSRWSANISSRFEAFMSAPSWYRIKTSARNHCTVRPTQACPNLPPQKVVKGKSPTRSVTLNPKLWSWFSTNVSFSLIQAWLITPVFFKEQIQNV